jgi:hypothetical protein
MEGRGYSWLGDPLLHLMLIVVLVAFLSFGRINRPAPEPTPEIGPEMRLIRSPSVAATSTPADGRAAASEIDASRSNNGTPRS